MMYILYSAQDRQNYVQKTAPKKNTLSQLLLGREVSLVIGPDTAFNRKGGVLANRANRDERGAYFTCPPPLQITKHKEFE